MTMGLKTCVLNKLYPSKLLLVVVFNTVTETKPGTLDESKYLVTQKETINSYKFWSKCIKEITMMLEYEREGILARGVWEGMKPVI